MKRVGAYGISALLGVGVASVGCGERAEAPLTNAERELVAQGYADSVRATATLTDSLCELRQADLVSYFADSLYEVRLGDIERQVAGSGGK